MGENKAVALAVKLAAGRVRQLGFRGSTPHLQRELPDGTVHLVKFQRVVSGVTGREPGFTVNLNVVAGRLRETWREAGDWRSEAPLRSGANIGVSERLGCLAFGYDRWWHPDDAESATDAADEVAVLIQRVGLPWFERITAEVR